MKRTIAALAVTVLILALVISGCGKSSEKAGPLPPPTPGTATAPKAGGPSAASTEQVTYAIIPKMLNNPVFTLARRGAEKAAKELGPNVKVIYQASETGKPAEQEEVIRNLTDKGVTGMSISVVDANTVREAINNAVDKGIIVMTFDSDCPDSKRATFFAVSDTDLGRELGRQLVAACGGKDQMKGEVGIISGQSSAPNLQARVKAVKEYLNPTDFPDLKFLPVLYCNDRPEKAVEQIRTTMQAHPDLRGWVMVGGWPLFLDGALDSIKDFNRTKVVSVDALPKELDYVENGQVYCLLAQPCFQWGYQSVMILNDLHNKTKTYPEFVNSGYDLVFKSPTPEQKQDAKQRKVGCYSVAEYRKLWKEWNSEM